MPGMFRTGEFLTEASGSSCVIPLGAPRAEMTYSVSRDAVLVQVHTVGPQFFRQRSIPIAFTTSITTMATRM
jgi:hypothetical protein